MPVKKISVFSLALGKDNHQLPYLSLGMVSAYVKVYDDGALNEFYNFEPIIPGGHEPGSLDDAKRALAEATPPIVLLSSYVWNHGLNIRTAKVIRQQKPRAVIVIGGPHVPKYEGETEEFLRENPFIDIAVLGEGEATMAEILTVLAGHNWPRDALGDLSGVPGIVYAAKRGDETDYVRTESRSRLKDIGVLPSPYLTGEFEPWFREFPAAILETNRGCPYGCTYCDWGSATLAKVTKFSAERVIAEIEHIAQHDSDAIFIADANFGMLEQDIEVAHALVAAHKKYGYP
ncbi:MAG: hypothetical protein HKN19_12650, partial [Halioglobus sp.]|nr:hypothetical protein [Halioglobus sp.]